MSERTAKALAKLDELLPLVKGLPPSTNTEGLIESGEALRRAVAAFHMEAIRFRMYTVERLLKTSGDARCLATFDEVRHELETAGFHTRSHAAPGT
jgi:hypothetical protein